jgi:hypothetical protein
MMLELDDYLGRYQMTYVHIYSTVHRRIQPLSLDPYMEPREPQTTISYCRKEGLPQRRKTMRMEMGENLACVAGTMEE